MDIKKIKQGIELANLLSDDPVCCGSEPRIVILQRGWVMVGLFSQKGTQCFLHNASVIRRWGTTMGLGELATKGPLPETKLEPTPLVQFHELTVIATIKCNEEKWKL